MHAISPNSGAFHRAAPEPPATCDLPSRQRAVSGRRIVAFVDPSPEATNAAWRGALVARDLGLPLHLVALHSLHVNMSEAAALVEALAVDMRAKLQLQVISEGLAGTREHEGVAAARGASLLVVPSATAHTYLRWLAVSRVLQILRRAEQPILVVRRPAYASYRRVLAAVKLELEARAIIAAAHALSRGPHITVLHVLASGRQASMSAVELPERATQSQCEAAALSARVALKDLIASTSATEGGAQPVILLGHAAHGVFEQQLANGADLLVLGKRPGNPIIDALHGGVVQVAISSADADVLILPTMPSAPDASSRPSRSRLGTEIVTGTSRIGLRNGAATSTDNQMR